MPYVADESLVAAKMTLAGTRGGNVVSKLGLLMTSYRFRGLLERGKRHLDPRCSVAFGNVRL